MKLRPYQEAAKRYVLHLAKNHDGVTPQSVMLAAPTGTGKTTCMISIQTALIEAGNTCAIITPSVEIIRGMLEKQGLDLYDRSNAWISKKGREWDVYTPVAYQNRLASGDIDPADVIIRDEGHEDAIGNITTDTILALAGGALFVAFTATPFRATNRDTARLRELYGEPIVILGIKEAVEKGWMALPEFIVEPICNDDEIKIRGKDFHVTSVFDHYTDEMDKSCDLIERVWRDAPTMCSIASTNLVSQFARELEHRGIPYRIVLANTPGAERGEAYETCQRGEAVLLQVSVVTRGVDLPRIRQLLDFRPTLSPVLWLQTVGRVARPGETKPKVYVTNRNLARFSYLLEGLIPPEYIIAEQEAFEAPCIRSHARNLGFEAIGRFKPTIAAHSSGGFLTCYVLDVKVMDGTIDSLAALFVPGFMEPIVAKRRRTFDAGDPMNPTRRTYGKWELCELPDDTTGYASIKKQDLTDKQKNFYRTVAHKYGICEPVENIDSRVFQVFTILKDIQI